MEKQDLKNLKKRYLIWLYKTNKEELDKVERKFTQLEIDRFILKELKKENKGGKISQFIDELEMYIQNKEKDGRALKYLPACPAGRPAGQAGENKDLKPQYRFLDAKLRTVERAIIKELGKKAMEEIKLLYEMEMIERILKSTEH